MRSTVAAGSGGVARWESSLTPEPARTALGDAGEMLDTRAKNAYCRRVAEIEDDIAQARALGDAEREAQADAERDFLVRELSRAVGLGGRDRRAASASERARVGVTRAIRYAIARIGEHHPLLGERARGLGWATNWLPDGRLLVTGAGLLRVEARRLTCPARRPPPDLAARLERADRRRPRQCTLGLAERRERIAGRGIRRLGMVYKNPGWRSSTVFTT